MKLNSIQMELSVHLRCFVMGFYPVKGYPSFTKTGW
jgi:hypothetical protein